LILQKPISKFNTLSCVKSAHLRRSARSLSPLFTTETILTLFFLLLLNTTVSSTSTEIPSTPQPDAVLITPPSTPVPQSPEDTAVPEYGGNALTRAPPLSSEPDPAPRPQVYHIPRSRPAPISVSSPTANIGAQRPVSANNSQRPTAANPRSNPVPQRSRPAQQRNQPYLGTRRNPDQGIQRRRSPTFRCADCRIVCNSRAAFVDHLQGRKHHNARLLKRGLPKCTDCNREFESDSHYQRHIRGKDHLAIVARNNTSN
jgi:hypothetical protein